MHHPRSSSHLLLIIFILNNPFISFSGVVSVTTYNLLEWNTQMLYISTYTYSYLTHFYGHRQKPRCAIVLITSNLCESFVVELYFIHSFVIVNEHIFFLIRTLLRTLKLAIYHHTTLYLKARHQEGNSFSF